MKNKYIIITATCLFLIVTGVCYSCSYEKNRGQEILLSSDDNIGDDDDPSKAENKDDIIHSKEDKPQSNSEPQIIELTEELHESTIYVHICGAVVNPDVYQVKTGTRLVELIDYAGGLIPEAADDYINQAISVEDGQRIYIPTKNELNELSVDQYVIGDNQKQSDIEIDKKVNINTADETRLMSLPGIGQAKAKSIIEYRNKNGSFKAIEDIVNISGIKEGLFTQIKDLLTVK